MNIKNREFIWKIEYLENDMAKKTLKSIKLSSKVYYLIYLLLTISYILLMIHVISNKGLFLITAIYLILALDLTFTQKRYTEKIMKETINKTICPEAYINLNIYNAKKLLCNKRMYKYSLNNIAYGYILLGDFENAEKIIKYVDSEKKDLILKSEILKNRIEVAFLKGNYKECNEECEKLKKIINYIPGKLRKASKLNTNIKQAIIEKDFIKVDELCGELEKNRKMFSKIKAAYYRGLVQEKRKKQNYTEYYKFVAENGNNLFIAKEVRKKIEINEEKNIYNKSNHIAYKIFKIVALSMLIVNTVFWSMYTIYIFNR